VRDLLSTRRGALNLTLCCDQRTIFIALPAQVLSPSGQSNKYCSLITTEFPSPWPLFISPACFLQKGEEVSQDLCKGGGLGQPRDRSYLPLSTHVCLDYCNHQPMHTLHRKIELSNGSHSISRTIPSSQGRHRGCGNK
jgi:hypothetical protein